MSDDSQFRHAQGRSVQDTEKLRAAFQPHRKEEGPHLNDEITPIEQTAGNGNKALMVSGQAEKTNQYHAQETGEDTKMVYSYNSPNISETLQSVLQRKSLLGANKSEVSKEEIEQMKQRIDELEKTVSEEKEARAREERKLKEEISEKDAVIQEQEREIQQLRLTLEKMADEKELLRSKNDDLKRQPDSQSKASKEEIEQMKQRIDELEKIVSEEKKARAREERKLKEEIAVTQEQEREIQQLRLTLEKMADEKDLLRSKNDDLKRQLDSQQNTCKCLNNPPVSDESPTFRFQDGRVRQ